LGSLHLFRDDFIAAAVRSAFATGAILSRKPQRFFRLKVLFYYFRGKRRAARYRSAETQSCKQHLFVACYQRIASLSTAPPLALFDTPAKRAPRQTQPGIRTCKGARNSPITGATCKPGYDHKVNGYSVIIHSKFESVSVSEIHRISETLTHLECTEIAPLPVELLPNLLNIKRNKNLQQFNSVKITTKNH